MSQTVTIIEVAAKLKVTERRIRQMVADGVFTAVPKQHHHEVMRILASDLTRVTEYCDGNAVSATEAAEMLQVTKQWIRKLLKRGDIAGLPRITGIPARIPVSELQRFAIDNDFEILPLRKR